MRFTILLSILSFAFFSCKSGIDTNKEDEASSTGIDKVWQKIDLDTLKGMYIGDFGGSDIRIVLNFISPNHAVGYNIHKGLQRNISGKVMETETTIEMELNEPGDHEFDGIFTLVFQKADFTCKGSWKALKKNIPKKKFELEKTNSDQDGLDYENLTLDKITKNNFTSVFSYCSDSLADIFFEEDGNVKYEFYPSKDTLERAEQMQIINGTWTFKDAKIYVNWQKNSVFTDKKTVMDVVINPEYDFYLTYKKRKFYPNLMGY